MTKAEFLRIVQQTEVYKQGSNRFKNTIDMLEESDFESMLSSIKTAESDLYETKKNLLSDSEKIFAVYNDDCRREKLSLMKKGEAIQSSNEIEDAEKQIKNI